MSRYLNKISINQKSIIPIYKQVANAIVEGVETGQIVSNDVLPSLYDFHIALDISVNSVRRAYNLLKKEGLVGSVPGKGFYIANCNRVVGCAGYRAGCLVFKELSIVKCK